MTVTEFAPSPNSGAKIGTYERRLLAGQRAVHQLADRFARIFPLIQDGMHLGDNGQIGFVLNS